MTRSASVSASAPAVAAARDLDAAALTAGFRRWLLPCREEGSYEVTDVVGEIPREIHGTLYRNGPSQNVVPQAGPTALHLFDGDGYVNAFRFEDGRVRHTAAFVRTQSFLFEEKQGRYCMNGASLPADVAVEDAPGRVQPNTNVLLHAGRLFAMVENAPPFELDPDSLAPLGPWDYDGRLLSYSTTAHPKVDGRTGQMLVHGYAPFEPYLQLYAVEPDGRVSLAEAVDAPYATMMHDLAITEHYVIFPLCPVLFDLAVLEQGRPFADALRWDPERPVRFGVRGREPGAAVRWFDARTNGFLFHFGNAYEERDGSRIVFDACVYPDGAALLDGLRRIRTGHVDRGFAAPPFAFEIDLASGVLTERQLDDQGAEFPRCDDRRVGYRNRFVYAALAAERGRTGAGGTFSTLVKVDRERGRSVRHPFGAGRWTGEPVFVPRAADAEEDDGFVLVTVYDASEDRSELVVLDARHFDGAPLARARLRHRVPLGFHGNFGRAG